MPAAILDRRAQRIQNRVDRYYRMGLSARKRRLTAKQLAQQHGISESVAAKAIAFARDYSAAQLREYLNLRRPDGLPLNFGYVAMLLTLPPAKRARFQRAIAQHGWLPPDAYRELKSRFPEYRSQSTGSVGGRPPKYAPGTPEHLRWLADLAGRLVHGVEQLDVGDGRHVRANLAKLRGVAHWLDRLSPG